MRCTKLMTVQKEISLRRKPRRLIFISSQIRHNVVFTCAAVPEDDGTLKLYWGAADTVMYVDTAVIDELVDFCLSNPRAAL